MTRLVVFLNRLFSEHRNTMSKNRGKIHFPSARFLRVFGTPFSCNRAGQTVAGFGRSLSRR